MVENERRICMEQERKLGICTRPITQLWNKPEALEAADELLCGWIYEVLEEKDGFLRVRTHYGYESWMDAKEYLSIPEQYKDRKGLYMVSAHMVDVLAEPRVQGRRMSTLFAGSLVRISEKSRTEDDWIRVVLPNGREGWMRTHFLMPRRDGDGFLEDGRLPGVSEEAASVQMGRKENEEALRQEIADRALSFLGTQYRWGGKTAMGIDCSGLAFMSYLMSGILIYRDARIMPGFPVREIPMGNPAETARVGDLLFFPGHVAVSLGDGRFVHATAYPGCGCVTVNSLNEKDPDFRKDLREKLIAVGSVFPLR